MATTGFGERCADQESSQGTRVKGQSQIEQFSSLSASATGRRKAEIQKLLGEAKDNLSQIREIASRQHCPMSSLQAGDYYKEVTRRIEECGTRNFSMQDGKRVYGELRAQYVLNGVGELMEAKVSKSSGKPFLDKYAIRLIEVSAPFGQVPSQMHAGTYTRFRLTNGFKFEHDPKNVEPPEPGSRCKL